MYKLKSANADFAINVPTKPEEITGELLTKLVSHISVSEHRAIVALRYKVNPFELVMAGKSQKKGLSVSVVPILAAYNGNLTVEPGTRISIAGSDLERALHLSNVSKISPDAIKDYINSDDALTKNVINKTEFKDVDYIYCLEFKIIGISSIQAFINDKKEKDPFIETD